MTSITDHGVATTAAPSMFSTVANGEENTASGFGNNAPAATETLSLMEPEPSVEDLERRRKKLAADLDAAVRRELAKIVKSPFTTRPWSRTDPQKS